MFPGVYRLWARVRRPIATTWERQHQHAFFAVREGRAALDTVWEQAFDAEKATSEKRAAAAVLVDMRSFFEMFNHSTLKDRAREAGFPETITRLALAAYRAPRLIVQDGCVSPPLRAGRGVIAGCGFAMTFVKVYCEKPFSDFCKRHPKVKLDAYVDDLTLSASAATDDEVAELLTKATEDLLATIRELLHC